MELLKERIRRDAKVRSGNVLKVDSFLNHQMDIKLFEEIGKEFKRRFSDANITKILTIEASGIGIACICAQSFDVPVVFAKKNTTKNIDGALYSAQIESFTHSRVYNVVVAREYLNENDNVLIIDDFLANGQALIGLSQIVKKSGANLVGAGIVIEKGFQNGGKMLRESGMRVESLAIVKSMSEDGIIEFE